MISKDTWDAGELREGETLGNERRVTSFVAFLQRENAQHEGSAWSCESHAVESDRLFIFFLYLLQIKCVSPIIMVKLSNKSCTT